MFISGAETFKNVEEWLASNPSKEVMDRVMNTINRGVVTEIRKEFHAKKGDLRKIEKVIKAMEGVKLPVPKEITDRVKGLEKEIADLEKQLPQPKEKK